jgi:hypothetical protein
LKQKSSQKRSEAEEKCWPAEQTSEIVSHCQACYS